MALIGVSPLLVEGLTHRLVILTSCIDDDDDDDDNDNAINHVNDEGSKDNDNSN